MRRHTIITPSQTACADLALMLIDCAAF